MAHSNKGMLAESIGNQLSAGVEPYEPEMGDIFVTVGKITRVGDKHIEYDTNTVHGFSGAAVVVFPVDTDNSMKVIAAHAGYSSAAETNFGFLLTSTPMPVPRTIGTQG